MGIAGAASKSREPLSTSRLHLDAVLGVAEDGVDEPHHRRQARAARQQPCAEQRADSGQGQSV